jgi:hypothetical protein
MTGKTFSNFVWKGLGLGLLIVWPGTLFFVVQGCDDLAYVLSNALKTRNKT